MPDCTDERACPTVVDAAQLLRLKVAAKHGSAECLAKACESAAAQAGSSAEPPNDAFKALMGAAIAKQRARSMLKKAEQQSEIL